MLHGDGLTCVVILLHCTSLQVNHLNLYATVCNH